MRACFYHNGASSAGPLNVTGADKVDAAAGPPEPELDFDLDVTDDSDPDV